MYLHSRRLILQCQILMLGLSSVLYGLKMSAFSSSQWAFHSKPEAHDRVQWLLAVPAEDDSEFQAIFSRVSDPTSPDYAQYYPTQEAIDALTRPSNASLVLISSWLHQHLSEDKDHSWKFIPTLNTFHIASSVAKTEDMLQTKLGHFHSNVPKDLNENQKPTKRRILRATTRLTVPSHLHDHIAYLTLNHYPVGHQHQQPSSRSLATAKSSKQKHKRKRIHAPMTPTGLCELYHIPTNRSVTNARSIQSIPQFFDESWTEADLRQFSHQILNEPGDIPAIQLKNTGDRPIDSFSPLAKAQGTGEATLDIEYITALAPNATTFIWNMDGRNPFSELDEPFVAWALDVLSVQENPPLVHSISYADDETHIFEGPDARAYAKSLDVLLQKMALRGMTVLVASGDEGSSGLRRTQYHASKQEACRQAWPMWPSSSPYVTSVGGTMSFQDHPEQEVVCSRAVGGIITSGGGFSTIYPTPEYQKQNVETYVQSTHVPANHPGFFNAQGRGYPDVAAYATAYRTIFRGHETSSSGTSASTPVVAAMVTLWNDRRLNAGKPPLGFLNPLLYQLAAQHPEAFQDIEQGDTRAGNGFGSVVCQAGFEAGPGWDAATGLGSPHFAHLDELLFQTGSTTPPPRQVGEQKKWMHENGETLVRVEQHKPKEGDHHRALYHSWIIVGGTLLLVITGIVGLVLTREQKRLWSKHYDPLENVQCETELELVQA